MFRAKPETIKTLNVSNLDYRLLKGCLAKKKYESRKNAKDLVSRAYKRSGAKLYIYQCQYCSCYHLTSKK